MHLKRSALALCMVSVLAMAGVSSGVAANNSNQTGLVNVSVGDVNVLNNVNLAVAANVVATVCDVTVPIAVLANQVIGTTGATYCTSSTSPVTISQAQNGSQGGGGGPGGNNSHQSGLVNVSAGDVNILNNTNLAIAANVVATVCDVTVPVAVLAAQLVADGSATYCTSTTSPVTITQA